jgi:hypothetical protein
VKREPAIFCSTAFDDAEFRAHGRTRVEVDGRLLRIDAWGPFNLELVQAQIRLLRSEVKPLLPLEGGFVELIHYHESILMPEPAWQALQCFVDQSAALGFGARTTLILVGEEVEGGFMFAERLASIWASSRPVQLLRRADELEQAVSAALSALQPGDRG